MDANVVGYGNVVKASSDASSSASRFYDNGADTTSSLSDNVYLENHTIANKVVPTSNAKSAIIGFDQFSQLKSNGKQTSQIPPPINQRSSSKYNTFYRLNLNNYRKVYISNFFLK